MKRVIAIVLGVIIGASLLALGFTFFQAEQERLALSADLQYRTRILAESLNESIEPAYTRHATSTLEKIAISFAGRERLVGVVIYGEGGNIIISSEGIPADITRSAPVVDRARRTSQSIGDFFSISGKNLYVHAHPIHRDTEVVGAFIVVQDAAYIDASIAGQWRDNLVGVLVYLLIFALAIAALMRWVIFKPLLDLQESIKSARSGKGGLPEKHHDIFFRPLATEIGKLTHSLAQARTAASEEARMRLEKIDTPWTGERLKEFIKAHIKDRPIFVVSHAEPYIHSRDGREVRYTTPAGGVVTAISSVMEACGGMWLAYGGGNADKETADESGKIRVPPEEPRYTLKRLSLSEKEMEGYYRGFSNEALWPLCHIAHTRPEFRKEDWTAYRRVNAKFAESLLAELRGVDQPIILVQDYHCALLPQMIKQARPDAQVALFWHIPWPSAEAFSICPWRKEILEGMLGADIIGFHTQAFCNNFIETVGKEIEALIDIERFAITHDEHMSHIKALPISIAFTGSENHAYADKAILKQLGINTKFLVLGVDRLDYTKGILERMRGIEFLFDGHPEYRGHLTFLQIGSPTRVGVEKYRSYANAVQTEAERINNKFRSNGWRPIVFENRQYSHDELQPLYKLADVCLVTSLHDGMNLVAKEFAAARDDEEGVLVLSKFTGASRDLNKGALVVNPYSAEDVAEAIHRGLTMMPLETARRMKAMRDSIKDYNVYRWAAELIKAVAALR